MRPLIASLATLLACFVALPAPAADWLYYTVPGDTLIGIGKNYLKNPRDWPKVQSANGVPIPEHLPANTHLKIPVPLLKVTPAPVTVMAVTGNVRYKPAGGGFQPLREGDQLKGGESVLTGPRSSAAYRFADGTTLTQQASSKLGFGRLQGYGKTGMVTTELALDSGRLEAQAAKQLAPAGGFRVKTPVAVAGLRGTGFRLNVDEAGQSLRGEVLEGAVAISAQGKSVRVEGGYGSITEKGKAPSAPRPLLSAPGAEGLPVRVERLPLAFAWSPVPDANHYRVQLARDEGFAQVLLDDTTPQPSLAWPNDLPDGDYHLRLRAVDAAGLEGLNRDHAFVLDARPLAPSAVAPAPDERLYDAPVRFTWGAAAQASGYLLQIAPTLDFGQGTLERRLPNQTEHAEALAEGDWHWRVASLDEAGQPHAWSPRRAFRLQSRPAAPVAPGQPADLAVAVQDDGLAVSWRGDATSYRVEMGTSMGAKLEADAGVTQLLASQTVGEPHALLAKPAPGDYWVRVKALGMDGLEGPASTVGVSVKRPVPWWLLLFLVPAL